MIAKPRPSLRFLLLPALLVALALALVVVPASGAGTTKGAPAKVVISQVSVKGTKVTIAGRVTLPVETAAQRQRTRVALSLIDSSGKTEQLSAKIDAKQRFKATKTTKLIGQVTVVAQVKIGGKTSGRQVRKAFAGPLAEGGAKGGSGAGGPLSPGSGGTLPPTPPPGVPPLVGLFKLEQGAQTVSGALSGTYFQMLPSVYNGDSTAFNKDFTLLNPGTEGGLRTDIYQPPPEPAFSGNNALANRIVQPQTFLGNNFSIATAPLDLQTSTPVPLATIYASEGKIGGQISYWDAQWGTLSFNQGTPKPDGSLPAGELGNPTIALTGTFNAMTSHFVLFWRSLIVGGPFNGFTGEWHLEGTFVPAT
jgi:hypothetical protein